MHKKDFCIYGNRKKREVNQAAVERASDFVLPVFPSQKTMVVHLCHGIDN